MAIIVAFFRDRFLFFLHGFDINLINDTKVESFVAYQKIYTSKAIMIFAGLVISIVTLLFSNRILSQNHNWGFRFVYWICWLFVVVFAINCFFFSVLPKRII